MKKNVMRLLCLIMTLSMLFLLGGCGATDAEKLVGTWNATVDLTDLLNEEITTGDETMDAYFKISDFTLVVTLTFNADGTYTMGVDENSLNTAMELVLADIKDGMYEYFEDVLAEAGLEMTVDELLEQSDVDLDALMDEAFSNAMGDEVLEGLSSSGNYEARDSKLYLSDGVEYAIDEEIYDTYTLDGKVLTFLEASYDNTMTELYPLTFEKVS